MAKESLEISRNDATTRFEGSHVQVTVCSRRRMKLRSEVESLKKINYTYCNLIVLQKSQLIIDQASLRLVNVL